MGIFSRIFDRNKPAEKTEDEKEISAEEDEWGPVPTFVPLPVISGAFPQRLP
jgi:hypothetical protein